MNMKTAISVTDSLFKQVEEAAKKMGISRSRLFSIAIQELLHHHYEENVTNKLNEVYQQGEGSLGKEIDKIQAHSIPEKYW
ncbi:hypothetical protein ES703_11694 [subsurface metagenome]